MIESCQLKALVRKICLILLLVNISISGYPSDILYSIGSKYGGYKYYDEVAFGGAEAWLVAGGTGDIASTIYVDILPSRRWLGVGVYYNRLLKVMEIADKAFMGCRNLISVTMCSNIINVREYAFYQCTSLPSILFTKKVGVIGDLAMY
jgi:hypothetical protein